MAMREIVCELAAMVGLGLLLSLLGPFGTFAMPMGPRMLDWLCFMLGGYALYRPVFGAGQVLARHSIVPAPLATAFACLLAAFPTTLLVAWCLHRMEWRQLGAGALVALYPQVALIGGLATLVQVAMRSRRAPAAADPLPAPLATPLAAPLAAPSPVPSTAPPAGPRPVAFLSRLPAAVGRDLLCLENEDHYVRAHTAQGSTLLLMRLGDAVMELDGLEGARTHRGWWVARSAIREIVRRDRAVSLRLCNGLEVPVARGMVATLRHAGWL